MECYISDLKSRTFTPTSTIDVEGLCIFDKQNFACLSTFITKTIITHQTDYFQSTFSIHVGGNSYKILHKDWGKMSSAITSNKSSRHYLLHYSFLLVMHSLKDCYQSFDETSYKMLPKYQILLWIVYYSWNVQNHVFFSLRDMRAEIDQHSTEQPNSSTSNHFTIRYTLFVE